MRWALNEYEPRVKLLDEPIDHVVHRLVGQTRILLADPLVLGQGAVLEPLVSILVQHEIPQLLAVERGDELIPVVNVQPVGASRLVVGDLHLAHHNDPTQRGEVLMPHAVGVDCFDTLMERKSFP